MRTRHGDTCHRFEDRAAYLALRAALGWTEAPPLGVEVVERGVLETTPPDEETSPEPLPGWHVDIAWRGVEMPEALAASRVTPKNRRYGWVSA